MRTNVAFALVVSFILSMTFFQASGFNAVIGMDNRGGVADDREALQKAAKNASAFGGKRSGGKSGGIVGVILGAARSLSSVLTLPLRLEQILVNIGSPRWFAGPIGTAVQLLVGLGLIQFVTGRRIQ